MLIMAIFDMITGACTSVTGVAYVYISFSTVNNATVWAPACYSGAVSKNKGCVVKCCS